METMEASAEKYISKFVAATSVRFDILQIKYYKFQSND